MLWIALGLIWLEARAARLAAEEAGRLALTADDFDAFSWEDWKKAVRGKTVGKVIGKVIPAIK